MKIFIIAPILLLYAVETLAGKECPPRQEIYPCNCININITKKKLFTAVTCNGLENTDSLNAILPILSRMEIDAFHMYDAFWPANLLGAAGESQRVLPTDWLTLLNIKELEVWDSTMSNCFACQWNLVCTNSVTKKLKIVNSTSSDKFCSFCNTRGSRQPWISCLTELEHFELRHGNIKSVTTEFFPLALNKLKILNLANNQISKIDPNSFRNLPKLRQLILSHNLIINIDNIIGSWIWQDMEYIDLSHNLLTTIGGNLMRIFPKIIHINFAYNQIDDFKQNNFLGKIPNELRKIDLTANPIKCDCRLKWVNDTFPVHVSISGTCETPDELKESKLRTASRYTIERCDANGRLGQRPKKKKTRS